MQPRWEQEILSNIQINPESSILQTRTSVEPVVIDTPLNLCYLKYLFGINDQGINFGYYLVSPMTHPFPQLIYIMANGKFAYSDNPLTHLRNANHADTTSLLTFLFEAFNWVEIGATCFKGISTANPFYPSEQENLRYLHQKSRTGASANFYLHELSDLIWDASRLPLPQNNIPDLEPGKIISFQQQGL